MLMECGGIWFVFRLLERSLSHMEKSLVGRVDVYSLYTQNVLGA